VPGWRLQKKAREKHAGNVSRKAALKENNHPLAVLVSIMPWLSSCCCSHQPAGHVLRGRL
jgi:hypothetical protein